MRVSQRRTLRPAPRLPSARRAAGWHRTSLWTSLRGLARQPRARETRCELVTRHEKRRARAWPVALQPLPSVAPAEVPVAGGVVQRRQRVRRQRGQTRRERQKRSSLLRISGHAVDRQYAQALGTVSLLDLAAQIRLRLAQRVIRDGDNRANHHPQRGPQSAGRAAGACRKRGALRTISRASWQTEKQLRRGGGERARRTSYGRPSYGLKHPSRTAAVLILGGVRGLGVLRQLPAALLLHPLARCAAVLHSAA